MGSFCKTPTGPDPSIVGAAFTLAKIAVCPETRASYAEGLEIAGAAVGKGAKAVADGAGRVVDNALDSAGEVLQHVVPPRAASPVLGK